MNDDKGPSPTSVDKALEFADAFVEGGALLRHDLTLTCKFLAAEVRRLRARDAEYKQLTEDWARVERKCETVQGINDRLKAENAELRTTLGQQREIWNMSTPNIRGELEWFRRHEQLVREIIEADEGYPEQDAVHALSKWLEANPKPGAGT